MLFIFLEYWLKRLNYILFFILFNNGSNRSCITKEDSFFLSSLLKLAYFSKCLIKGISSVLALKAMLLLNLKFTNKYNDMISCGVASAIFFSISFSTKRFLKVNFIYTTHIYWRDCSPRSMPFLAHFSYQYHSLVIICNHFSKTLWNIQLTINYNFSYPL